jgi:translation elongation factor EF-1beta
MLNEPTEQVATIPANAGKIAMRVAIMESRRRVVKAQLKSARAALREAIQRTDAWNEADGIKREIRESTKESRKEIAQHLKTARMDVSITEFIGTVEHLADSLRTLDGLESAELADHEQILLPFARECGL